MKKHLRGALLCLLSSLLILCSVSCTDPVYNGTDTPVTMAAAESATDTDATDTESSSASDTATSTPPATLPTQIVKAPELDILKLPPYIGNAYTAVNGNIPFFEESEYSVAAFELYSPLDSLGRCSTAYANVCKDTMPTDERGSIGSVKPSGWQTVKYDAVDGKYLYNRAHLIGWQLTGENANRQNLITGTRYMNVDGMLPFENMIADYLKEEEEHHVLYRVTPIFAGDELVARGVLMEAYSVEDKGEGISFCVYCYNVQPGITIDYSNGASSLRQPPADSFFILNTSTKKFHCESCSAVKKIAEKNKGEFFGFVNDLIKDGYSPCGICKP